MCDERTVVSGGEVHSIRSQKIQISNTLIVAVWTCLLLRHMSASLACLQQQHNGPGTWNASSTLPVQY